MFKVNTIAREFDRKAYIKLQIAYQDAVDAKAEGFLFIINNQPTPLLTSFAKYLVEYLHTRFLPEEKNAERYK